jgi:hypothetical protein
MTKVEKIDNFLMQTDKSLNYLTIAYINVVLSYIYIHTHTRRLYSEHTLRCWGVYADPPPSTQKKSKKAENLVSSKFYGSISLIAELQHSNQSVTMVVIPQLQHIQRVQT